MREVPLQSAGCGVTRYHCCRSCMQPSCRSSRAKASAFMASGRDVSCTLYCAGTCVFVGIVGSGSREVKGFRVGDIGFGIMPGSIDKQVDKQVDKQYPAIAQQFQHIEGAKECCHNNDDLPYSFDGLHSLSLLWLLHCC